MGFGGWLFWDLISRLGVVLVVVFLNGSWVVVDFGLGGLAGWGVFCFVGWRLLDLGGFGVWFGGLCFGLCGFVGWFMLVGWYSCFLICGFITLCWDWLLVVLVVCGSSLF